MFNMEKYAVIKLASKQYLVREGDIIELERQEKPLKIGVLMYSDGSKLIIGEPEAKEVSVKAVVLEEKLGKKVRVARFKKKSRYERVRGHRQPLSVVKVEEISLGGAKESVKKESPEEKKILKEKPVKKPASKTKDSQKKESKKPIKKLKGSK